MLDVALNEITIWLAVGEWPRVASQKMHGAGVRYACSVYAASASHYAFDVSRMMLCMGVLCGLVVWVYCEPAGCITKRRKE